MNPSFDLTSLPHDLRRHLLLGFSGRLHLQSATGSALAGNWENSPIIASIAQDLFLAAWGENPFDGNCVAGLASHLESLPPVSPVLLPVIRAVLSHWHPEVTPEARIAMSADVRTQMDFLRNRLVKTPQNLFWWHHLYEFVRINSQWEFLVEMISSTIPRSELASLFAYAKANAMLALGEVLPAAGMYRENLNTLPLPVVKERLITAWLRSGKEEKALGLLERCVAERPWNVSLWLRLHDHLAGSAKNVARLPGRVTVLGYSWNKADDLVTTLDSLLSSKGAVESDIRVCLLDNGSSDTTSDVINHFIEKFGPERASSVALPVNVGAPAARNWLMHLPEVQVSDFVAYIDDDIALPGDWLGRLGEAVKQYPDAGVWGCKVVDFNGPARMQCGEHNLAPSPGHRQEALMGTLMLQDADFGQADYIRPCASVTGCVHLFRIQRLLETGDFDLRFSPTQYDDLERDLRMVLAGGYAVYTGFLSIAHKRKSGAQSELGGGESAGATANLRKLMTKYEPEEFEKMARDMDKVLLADLLAKQAQVGYRS